jgi:hypothetical protein
LHQEASHGMQEAGKYADDISADQLANVPAFADIFAAHDGRPVYGMPEDFRSPSVHFRYSHGHIAVL